MLLHLQRNVLIGYRYGISSERKLVQELRRHLAWRWFTGLGFVQEQFLLAATAQNIKRLVRFLNMPLAAPATATA